MDVQQAVAHLQKADPVLDRIIQVVGECTLQRRGEPYEVLVRGILYQQLAGAAASAIERRFLALYDGRTPSPGQLLVTADEALRGAGLSRQKIGYLRDLALKFADGAVDAGALPSLPDEEVVTRVTEIKGIGRWTAEMLLIFCLGRPDVLPVDDLGLRRSAQLAYGLAELPTAKVLQSLAESWRPYRSVATWYLWRSLAGGVQERSEPE